MKLINHKEGNYFFLNHGDSSVMYGSITMDREEYDLAIDYLYHKYRTADYECETWTRDGLSHLDFKELTEKPPLTKYICLGVVATKLLCEANELRYKRQNYRIKIK